jgi:hypothetical protein
LIHQEELVAEKGLANALGQDKKKAAGKPGIKEPKKAALLGRGQKPVKGKGGKAANTKVAQDQQEIANAEISDITEEKEEAVVFEEKQQVAAKPEDFFEDEEVDWDSDLDIDGRRLSIDSS